MNNTADPIKYPGEQIYGIIDRGQISRPDFSYSRLDCLISDHANGLLLLDPILDGKHVEMGDWCRQAGLDLIIGFTDNPLQPNLERLEKALTITKKLAIGNTHLNEWVGRRNDVTTFKRMGDRYGFEWVSLLTHHSLLVNLRKGESFRRAMGETLCMCLCAYVIAGYLYDEPRIPHMGRETTLGGKNLHKEFGVTIENLRALVEPMNMLSGAGWQPGLDVGSRVYAQELGFKGMVIGMPFKLAGTEQVVIKPKPEVYPERCGPTVAS